MLSLPKSMSKKSTISSQLYPLQDILVFRMAPIHIRLLTLFTLLSFLKCPLSTPLTLLPPRHPKFQLNNTLYLKSLKSLNSLYSPLKLSLFGMFPYPQKGLKIIQGT
mmetsp:Transcript_698/g.1327  ORF Transcript_698/g.1327 Transcript_698/m.1327 type:complete len:107 (+) Transcript_698:1927-2247(+)